MRDQCKHSAGLMFSNTTPVGSPSSLLMTTLPSWIYRELQLCNSYKGDEDDVQIQEMLVLFLLYPDFS